MAAKHLHCHIAGFQLFLCLFFIGRCIEAQSSPNGSTDGRDGSSNIVPNFRSDSLKPPIAIIILLVCVFFCIGFFSIYMRQCGGNRIDTVANAAAGRVRIQRGIDPAVLETFPTLVYSDVKEHKVGKGALECAICLNEFEDDETIRLLPKCDHVFHQECIDAWLETHVTCPVCRANYAVDSANLKTRNPARNDGEIVGQVLPEAVVPPDGSPSDHVVITVDTMDERKEEMLELARIASKVRGDGARRSRRLPKSHSTGHSMMPLGEAGLDRYTLRLPENVRKGIIAAGKLQRARTFAVTVSGTGEASMRRISRGVGEGSSRRGRTIRLGQSDRWPSFFGRSLSAKISTWGNRRRGEEGHVKERSMSRKLSGVITTVDCLGGGGSSGNGNGDSHESSTAVLNRV